MSVVKNECAMVASPSETSTGGKRKREGKLRSKVWEHFTKHENKPECVCNHCERVFSCKTNAGTTPLQRHIFWGRCAVYNKENEGKVETLPKNTKRSLGQDRNFVPRNLDEECSLRDLTELIINWELPFNFVEDPSFQKYIRGIYPTYKFPSWIAMRSDCMKRYELEKNILKDILEHSKPRVCLTFDTWTSSKDLPYMAIRVHFIDKGWKLHKRIINFVLVPVKESGENLADVIIRCLLEWNIKKICTITLDNCTTNDVLARTLSEHYSSRSSLLLQGCAVQVRCWGRILNLIVQEGLDEIKDSIRRIRNAVKYVKMTPGKEFEFLQFADQEGIPRGKMLALDNYTQWNSTYKMLGSVLPYRWAYDRMRSCDRHFKDPPTPEDWEKAKIVRHFLETFFSVINTVCGTTKCCTANVFFNEVYRILTLLRDTATDLGSLRGRMALNMLEKFEKYWMEKEPNILLSVAVVLDPRCKLKYLRFCYNKIYDSSLVGDLMDRVEGELRKLFDEYMAEYEASCCVEATSNKSSDEGTPSVISTNLIEDFFKFSEEEDIFQSKTELDVFLEEKLYRSQTPSDEEDFDILQWWKANSSKFRVLSRMARDVLAIPVSSVASECAFSTHGGVLSEFHSSLLPSTVEALVCSQDWIRGEPVQTDFEEEMDKAFAGNWS
ncbi:zinc finger BED domain-containing protein RICESLEEPER 2-like isoform X1 [Actinidia eriantha]|uniref:zinc finger BED domain-containing protein RICESLEEPER 2-like isoform X1 n=1 Tax=Actinidia eriantha TaxID=165200 RepID=UPI0025894151|nr:zinc finger BED domain-containing protein RICESLEEPER 2-like isoform X1 [Actinidia eriantha]